MPSVNKSNEDSSTLKYVLVLVVGGCGSRYKNCSSSGSGSSTTVLLCVPNVVFVETKIFLVYSVSLCCRGTMDILYCCRKIFPRGMLWATQTKRVHWFPQVPTGFLSHPL